MASCCTRSSSGPGSRGRHGRGGGQAQREELLGHRVVQVARQPRAFLDHGQLAVALVEPRVGQRDRGVRGEQREEVLVAAREPAGVAGLLVGQEEDAERLVAVADRHAEEVLEDGVRRRPPLERRGLADVREPLHLVLAQHQREEPVLARQRPDRGPLLGADALDDELRERPLVVGDAERGVTGVEELRGGSYDHLEHLVHGQVAGDGEHRRADRVQCGVPIGFHGPDGTFRRRARARRHVVLGRSAEDRRVMCPMTRRPPRTYRRSHEGTDHRSVTRTRTRTGPRARPPRLGARPRRAGRGRAGQGRVRAGRDRDRRRHRRPRAPRRAAGGRGRAGPAREQRERARRHAPPAAGRLPAGELEHAFAVNTLGAARARSRARCRRCGNATARSSTSAPTPRASRTRAGAATARPRPRWTSSPTSWPPRSPPSRSGGSTRARCGPTMLAAAGEDAASAPLPEDVAVPALLRLIADRRAQRAVRRGGVMTRRRRNPSTRTRLWAAPYRTSTVGILLVVTLLAFEAMAVGTVMPVAARDLNGLSLYAWAFSAVFIARAGRQRRGRRLGGRTGARPAAAHRARGVLRRAGHRGHGAGDDVVRRGPRGPGLRLGPGVRARLRHHRARLSGGGPAEDLRGDVGRVGHPVPRRAVDRWPRRAAPRVAVGLPRPGPAGRRRRPHAAAGAARARRHARHDAARPRRRRRRAVGRCRDRAVGRSATGPRSASSAWPGSCTACARCCRPAPYGCAAACRPRSRCAP